MGRWWWIISLEPPLPTTSSGARGRSGQLGQPLLRGPKPWPCSRPGFTKPAPLDAAGALLPHLCTLTCAEGVAPCHRRCVSVALSSRFPALGVTQQAWPLGSPDFPQLDPPSARASPGQWRPVAITSPAFAVEPKPCVGLPAPGSNAAAAANAGSLPRPRRRPGGAGGRAPAQWCAPKPPPDWSPRSPSTRPAG
jgi:hypothetical protein